VKPGAVLRSVSAAPVRILPWPEILEDLGHPSCESIARALDVDPVFVDQWNRHGTAPKWACLALWWLTSYGQAMVYEKAERDCQLAVACCLAAEKERDELLAQLGRPLGRSMLSRPQEARGSLPLRPATWCDLEPAHAIVDRVLSGDVVIVKRGRSPRGAAHPGPRVRR
jgi:hypothetical protein